LNSTLEQFRVRLGHEFIDADGLPEVARLEVTTVSDTA